MADPDWRIYSRNPGLPPHFVGGGAKVQNSLISEGGTIYGSVDSSVLFSGVTVEEDAEVTDSIVMPGAVIQKGAKVHYAIVAEDAVIGENARVGRRPEEYEKPGEWGVAVVAHAGVKVALDSIVPPKAMIDSDTQPEGGAE